MLIKVRVNLAGGLAVKSMVFVAHQHRHRVLKPFGVLEGHRDSVGVGIAFDQVVFDPEGVKEVLCVGGGRVCVDSVPGPTALTYHQHNRDVHAHCPTS